LKILRVLDSPYGILLKIVMTKFCRIETKKVGRFYTGLDFVVLKYEKIFGDFCWTGSFGWSPRRILSKIL